MMIGRTALRSCIPTTKYASQISPGVTLLPGEYRFTRFRSNLLSTATKRRLSGSVNLTYGATGLVMLRI